jgi:hypothetical protein
VAVRPVADQLPRSIPADMTPLGIWARAGKAVSVPVRDQMPPILSQLRAEIGQRIGECRGKR